LVERILVPAPAASTITAAIGAEPLPADRDPGSDDVMSTAHPSCDKALLGSDGLVNTEADCGPAAAAAATKLMVVQAMSEPVERPDRHSLRRSVGAQRLADGKDRTGGRRPTSPVSSTGRWLPDHGFALRLLTA
jgi:hypothetical protein